MENILDLSVVKFAEVEEKLIIILNQVFRDKIVFKELEMKNVTRKLYLC